MEVGENRTQPGHGAGRDQPGVRLAAWHPWRGPNSPPPGSEGCFEGVLMEGLCGAGGERRGRQVSSPYSIGGCLSFNIG